MSNIRSKNTKPELLVRKYLFSKGYRFRLHPRNLQGKPDIVLTKKKTAIFIHGCFWHGHIGCKYYIVPKTRTKWWLQKIGENRLRDDKNTQTLINMSWKVIVIYECDLDRNNRENTLKELINELH